ncbi:MAG: hypothetical protein ABII22_03350 [Candidatus Micrarchaeota archaeon]
MKFNNNFLIVGLLLVFLFVGCTSSGDAAAKTSFAKPVVKPVVTDTVAKAPVQYKALPQKATSPYWASIEIYDQGKLSQIDIVQESYSSKYTRVAGSEYNVFVERVNPGYTYGAKWAKISIVLNGVAQASGVVNTGESLSAGTFKVTLKDLAVNPKRSCAIMSGNLLCIGSPIRIGGETVVLEKISPGYSYGAKWAQVKYDSSPVSRVLNTGDSVTIGGQRVTLEDISIANPNSGRASFQVKDANGNVLIEDSLEKGGQTIVRLQNQYTISVSEIAPGYTYAAKWARVSINSDAGVVFDGVAFIGQTIPLGNGGNFILTDLTGVPKGSARAIVSVLDNNRNVLSQQAIVEGATKSVLGMDIEIKKVNPGYTFASKWARIKVGVLEGVIGFGDTLRLNNGEFGVRLDDISIQNSETSRALLQISRNGNLVKEVGVREGSNFRLDDGKTVTVNAVAPGYTYGAKWADISLDATRGVIGVGDQLNAGDYSIKLMDLSTYYPETSRASIRVNDANGNALYFGSIGEGASEDTGLGFNVQVKEVALGYADGAKWARLLVNGREGVVNVGERVDVRLANGGRYTVALEDLTVPAK